MIPLYLGVSLVCQLAVLMLLVLRDVHGRLPYSSRHRPSIVRALWRLFTIRRKLRRMHRHALRTPPEYLCPVNDHELTDT